MELRDVVPFVVPVLVGVATALISRAIITASGLRKELAADVQLLAALPNWSRAYGQLNSSVQVRALRLVGLVRYPAFATTDLLGVLGVLVCAAASVGLAVTVGSAEGRPDLFETMIPLVMLAAGAWASWWLFFYGWSSRAAARFRFVEKHLDAAEVEELAVLFRGVQWTILAFSPFVVFVPPLALLAVALGRGFGVPVGPFALGAMVLFLLCWHALTREVMKSPLADALPLPPFEQRRVDRARASLAAQGADSSGAAQRQALAARRRWWHRGRPGAIG